MSQFDRLGRTWLLVGLVASLAATSGCTMMQGGGLCGDIPAIPAHRLPPELRARSHDDLQQISISRLRQNPPEVYQLGPGDVLGVYIEFVLGQEGEAPPVHFPDQGDQAPALGYPVPVREDGTLALPLVAPVKVGGLSLSQATEAVREAYTGQEILQPGQDKIIVTLLRRRMHRVLVIREESGGKENVSKRGTGETIDLPAYENDVLHALNETGGMPGLDAKNEVIIIRGGYLEGAEWDEFVANIRSRKEPCTCPPAIPDAPNVTRIPLLFYPERVPKFSEKDILLETGDIVYIASRDEERYYTGGVMQGGQHLLPRDYDLDVLGAIAEGGGQVGSGGSGIGQGGGGNRGGGRGGMSGANPSRLIVVRKLPCGGQVPIEVDVNRALMDESHRLLLQPEDTLILRYRLHEELYNAALNLVSFNFLFSGFGGGF